MATGRHKLDKRVELVLSNLRTVREVQSIIKKDGPLAREMEQVMEHVKVSVRRQIPALRPWTYDKSVGPGLDIYPDKRWRVSSEESICFSISVAELFDENPMGNPFVGLYIPKGWKGQKKMVAAASEIARSQLDEKWIHEEVFDEWPAWVHLSLDDCSKNGVFEINRMINEIVKAMKELAPIYSNIDKAVRRIRKKQ